MIQDESISHGNTLADSREDKRVVTNEVSDETGQFDPRFTLWRKFCADHGIDVNTLPGDLSRETKEQWEKFKETERLPGR
ncbi:MAG TPA: hypothetical protein VJT71_04370 [Pyrinomonadaceae bacterium]|nr:hypothetical protein [Pyrinomonadaceae bacterium]